MVDRAYLMMLDGYRLTTAEILYHLPDHDHLLQTFIWQDYDLSPDFPRLFGFLSFWRDNLDGRLHSIRVGSMRLIGPSEVVNVAEFRLN